MMRVVWLGALVLAAACGGDAATGTVAVTVTENLHGAPVAGVPVHFQGEDSSLFATVRTDANGVASAEVAPGGYVSVVDVHTQPMFGATHDVYTIAGVEPGDQLAVQLHFVELTVPTQAPVHLFFPAGSQQVERFDAYTTCGQALPGEATESNGIDSIVLQVSSCASAVDVVLESVAADPFAAVVVHDVALGTSPVLDVPALQPLVVVQPVFAHMPGDMLPQKTTIQLSTARGPLLAVESAGPAIHLAVPAGDFAFVEEDALSPPLAPLKRVHRAWGAKLTANAMYDLTGPALPGSDDMPAWDVATHGVTWSLDAGGADGDLTFTGLQTYGFNWHLVGPYAKGNIPFPTIPPTDGVTYDVTADSPYVYLRVTGSVTAAGGYASLRGTAFAKPLPASLMVGEQGESFGVEWGD